MLDLDFKFQTIFDYLDHPVYISDPKTYEILYYNKKVEELVPEIEMGRKCYRTLQGFDTPCSFCTNDKLFGENHISPFIWEHYNKKLGKWYHCTDQVILWKGNRQARFELAIDITELKLKENEIKKYTENLEEKIKDRVKELNKSVESKIKIEEKLKKTLVKFQNIVENMNELIIVTGFNGNRIYTSPKFSRVFSRSSNSKSILFDKIHMEDREKLIQLYNKAIQNREVLGSGRLEFRVMNYEEKYKWFESETNNYFDQNGDVIGFITSLRDITEKKESELKLKESEEKYRSLVEDAKEGIWALDENENTIFANPEMCQMLGYSKDELLSKNLHSFIPESMESLIKGNRCRREKGIKETYELQLLKKDGTIIYTEVKAAPIIDNHQKYRGSFAYITDITEKKKAEQLIIKENKRLLELHKIRQDLLNRISHELKTPLTSIFGIIQFLMSMDKTDLEEKADSLLEIGYRGAIRLKELINNLLDSSKLDNGKIDLELNTENLSILLKNCIYELSYLAKSRKIILKSNIPEKIYVEIDNSRFSQVIFNIITNAIKNTPPKGLVFIRLTEYQNHVDIIVKDTGIGITKEEKERLFQKFGKIERYGKGYNLDIEGVGLGLFISKGILDLHGGEILVESEGRNRGSTFIIRLFKKNITR